MSIRKGIYFHYGWKFLLADAFPLKDALNKWRDAEGHFFKRTRRRIGRNLIPSKIFFVTAFRMREAEEANNGILPQVV